VIYDVVGDWQGDERPGAPRPLHRQPPRAAARAHQARASETNSVVEGFYESLKYEHIYRLEVADGQALVEELEAYRKLFQRDQAARASRLPHTARGLPDPVRAQPIRG
jgi:hypothetical protein